MSLATIGYLMIELSYLPVYDSCIWAKVGHFNVENLEPSKKKLKDILKPNDKISYPQNHIYFISIICFWIPFPSTCLKQNKAQAMI